MPFRLEFAHGTLKQRFMGREQLAGTGMADALQAAFCKVRLGQRHGTRIGVLVDVVGGDADLGKDLAMHIAASSPRYLSADEVPEEIRANERRILSEQAQGEGKPAEIVAKMVEGRLRKYLNEIVLLGQSFVKDPDISIEKLLKQRGARVQAFVRLEVGEGIEKKSENIAEAVAAMHSGA